MKTLSHIDKTGRAVMVDVSEKEPQLRIARAAGRIRLSKATVRLVRRKAMKKGDVLTVAEVAGVQAAKKTAELIPLCHPLQLTDIDVRAAIGDEGICVESEVRCVDRTGAEMEALTAVTVALLAVYDMCKAVDKKMRIERVRLVEKTKEEIHHR